MTKGRFAILRLFALFIGVSFVGTSCGQIVHTMPDYAIVFVDDQDSTYTTPICVGESHSLRSLTAEQARNLGYRSDRQCRNEGGFMQVGRTLPGALLEKLGILKPLPSRWNTDGSWNW